MMTKSCLFSLNNEGRIYTLSTDKNYWKEFCHSGLEFKTLSSVPNFLWAVGSDHQIYLYVYGLEKPIIVKEEAYENERWLPLEGFSCKLLPTDRHHFSSCDGTVERKLNSIRVPSMAWQWEQDWHLELTHNNEPLNLDGWTYAIDFPATYYAEKYWNSCVRRRKWIRYRKYIAMDSWCAIAPLHGDPTQEPFIFVSVGGYRMTNAPKGFMSVWAVTTCSRVMFRSGVSTTSPEGLRWTNVTVPSNCNVKLISVGTKGLVWVLLWTGRVLVRTGVKGSNPIGDTWVEIKSPVDNKLSLISVGSCGVWGLSNDGRVWFRKGIDQNNFDASEEAATGTAWTKVEGSMSYISVTGNDNVFAIGYIDKNIYWRIGITAADLLGKKWKCLHVEIYNDSSLTDSSEYKATKLSDSVCLNEKKPSNNTDSGSFETTSSSFRAWSPVRSVGSVVGVEAFSIKDKALDVEALSDEEVEKNNAEKENNFSFWKRIEAGGCVFHQNDIPDWFSKKSLTHSTDILSTWRKEIFYLLQKRNVLEDDCKVFNKALEEERRKS